MRKSEKTHKFTYKIIIVDDFMLAAVADHLLHEVYGEGYKFKSVEDAALAVHNLIENRDNLFALVEQICTPLESLPQKSYDTFDGVREAVVTHLLPQFPTPFNSALVDWAFNPDPDALGDYAVASFDFVFGNKKLMLGMIKVQRN